MAEERDERRETAEQPPSGADRREFVKGSLVLGAGLVGSAALGCFRDEQKDAPAAAPPAAASASHAEENKANVPPGKLDDYYGFWSGGQSGEIRILGVPSMRELKRIPVFNRDAATG